MDKSNQKIIKGGTEEECDRKKLLDSASRCRSLLDMFNSTDSGRGEVSEHGDKGTKLVARLPATRLVDDQLAAAST